MEARRYGARGRKSGIFIRGKLAEPSAQEQHIEATVVIQKGLSTWSIS